MKVSFDKQALLAALNPAAGIALASVDGLLFETEPETKKLPRGLQYFAESSDSGEAADLLFAMDNLEKTLISLSHQDDQAAALCEKFRKWRSTHRSPAPKQCYRIMRECGGGDIVEPLWKKFHPEEVLPGTRQQRPMLTLEAFENWLGGNGIRLRRNLITHKIEVDGIPDGELDEEQAASQGAAYIHDRLKREFSCTTLEVGADMQIIAGRNSYNPVLELIEAAEPWDGRDRIAELSEILGIAGDTLSETLVFKWLLQCYCLQYNSLKSPFTGEGVLVLVGPQGIGKTTVFRALALAPKLFAEGVALGNDDKDSQLLATSAWICELGELDGTLRKSDAAFLKGFLLKAKDEIRSPYAAAANENVRRTSHCGTCNEARFLVDPTGNRRYWTIPVSHIDLNKLRTDFDVVQLWKEIESLVLAGAKTNPLFIQNCFRLSKDENDQLGARNDAFAKPLPGEDEIRDLIARSEIEPNLFGWRFTTLTEFVAEHELRIPVNKLRPAIDRIAMNDDRIRQSSRCPGTDKQGRYVRLPMYKSKNTSLTAAIEEKLKNG